MYLVSFLRFSRKVCVGGPRTQGGYSSSSGSVAMSSSCTSGSDPLKGESRTSCAGQCRVTGSAGTERELRMTKDARTPSETTDTKAQRTKADFLRLVTEGPLLEKDLTKGVDGGVVSAYGRRGILDWVRLWPYVSFMVGDDGSEGETTGCSVYKEKASRCGPEGLTFQAFMVERRAN